MPPSALFAALARPRLAHPTAAWLDAVLDDRLPTGPGAEPAGANDAFDAGRFRLEWARVGRRAGARPFQPTPEELDVLRRAGLWPLHGWAVDELARAALLARAVERTPADTHVPLLRALYADGTIRERQALLRALSWLPEPARFAEIAVAAIDARVVSVFSALALGNPYPARWLSRARFEQLVRRALALRLPPERIVGLAARTVAVRPPPHAALPALLAP